MNSNEKEISYTTSNSYSTLNTLTDTTKTVWFACHGMGYLSRYFLRYFKDLNPNENYIIAPQAPSKYYQLPKMHVGANWLTRENTDLGMENIINYFYSIFEAEQLAHQTKRFIIFGYSQGVSVAMRYMARHKIQCNELVIHSGGIPKELQANAFEYLSRNTKVHMIYGTEDEFLKEERIIEETALAQKLFGSRLIVRPFEGKHVVNVDYINDLA